MQAERALMEARAKDDELARGGSPGPLFGLPIAHKDLLPTAGIRTTYGSPIYRDHVPDEDALIVERARQLAYAFEQATGFGKRRPAIAQP